MNKLEQAQSREVEMKDTVIHNPPANWVASLRRGSRVWLVKEQGFAHIEAPHDKDGWCGRIFLSRGGPPERWYCQLDGKGLDGTQPG